MAPARHWFEGHTSEVTLCLEAPSWPLLLEEAAKGLAQLQADGALARTDDEALDVQLRSVDRVTLLIDWLNELIFLSDRHKRIFCQTEALSATDDTLTARVRGARPEVLKTAVKAATLHRAAVEVVPHGLFARAILDV